MKVRNTRKKMLPRLDHLSLCPTGAPPAKRGTPEGDAAMQEVMESEDLVAAILGAIDASDAESACVLAKKWCASGPVQAEACRKGKDAWRTLLERAFGDVYEGDEPRARFNAMCRRIEQYENGTLVFGNYEMVRVSSYRDAANHSNPDARVRAFVRAAIRHDPRAILLSPFAKTDRELAFEAFMMQPYLIQYTDNVWWADREVMVPLIKRYGWPIQRVPPEMKAERDLALAAVKVFGRAIESLPQFVHDREMVLAAASNDVSILEKYPEYRNDFPFMLEAVRSNPEAWAWASDALRRRREIVLAAVRGSGDMLYFMTPTRKADKEIVLAALAESPDALMFASEALRSDPDVMRAAQEGWDNGRRGNDKAWKLFFHTFENRRVFPKRVHWPHWRFDRRRAWLLHRKISIDDVVPNPPDVDPRDWSDAELQLWKPFLGRSDAERQLYGMHAGLRGGANR